MRHGQLGTDHQKRVIFIWEGAVATLPKHRAIRSLEWLAARTGQSRKAVDYWTVQYWSLALMWSFYRMTNWRIDICVTTREPAFARAVARKVLEENWPVGYVYCIPAQDLGRTLGVMPDVERVYYGLEEQRWAYGPHGFFVGPDVPIAVF